MRTRSLGAPAVLFAALAVAASGALSQAPVPARAPHAGPVVSAAPRVRVEVDDAQVGPRANSVLSSVSDSSGYTYLASSIVGQTPSGLRLYVSPSAPHHWIIAKYTAATAAALHRLGLGVRYRGYGSPAANEGVVRVREGRKGCGSNSSTVGMTWTYWNSLANGQDYVTHADVYLCPRLFRLGTWATQATVGHELGHAMGLGHFAYRYLGSYQLMNPTVRPGVRTYRYGDRRGLLRLARQTAAIKVDLPPFVKLDSSTYQSDWTIDFRGGALLKYFRTDPVTISLADNGTVIRQVPTPILRADVNASLDPGTRPHGFDVAVPWTGGQHKYCVRATSVTHPRATAQLGCVTWSS